MTTVFNLPSPDFGEIAGEPAPFTQAIRGRIEKLLAIKRAALHPHEAKAEGCGKGLRCDKYRLEGRAILPCRRPDLMSRPIVGQHVRPS